MYATRSYRQTITAKRLLLFIFTRRWHYKQTLMSGRLLQHTVTKKPERRRWRHPERLRPQRWTRAHTLTADGFLPFTLICVCGFSPWSDRSTRHVTRATARCHCHPTSAVASRHSSRRLSEKTQLMPTVCVCPCSLSTCNFTAALSDPRCLKSPQR
ncbi:hypothetical protein JOB18_032469 [Solea senegalensis]|uniref:Uncharacterized protein n=1 Tax=Solea senegalensis TaxID=28829 RepID=A0AAV6S1Q5_SOLSE|nr:hypothetical protein JOB18_032469 [Solea senegalensis]